ncbi:MAG: hypothetical protein HQ478_00325 [Chloroflexi bacterium]|nr:hypothetical protein [Chloroflexota bacterium]
MLFDREWSEEEFPDTLVKLDTLEHRLELGWLKPTANLKTLCEYVLREFRSYVSYQRRSTGHNYYLQRQQRYLTRLFPRNIGRVLKLLHTWDVAARVAPLNGLAKLADRAIPPHRAILSDIKAYDPDVVVVTPATLRYAAEIGYLKAARHLNIPTVIPVFSWDNLTTKGLIPFTPDRLLVWNKSQRSEAQKIHGIKRSNIEIIGSPLFDKWFDRKVEPLDRREFESAVGLGRNARFVLYMGSSANIAGDEGRVPVDLANAIRTQSEALTGEVMVLVRPHPANEGTFQDIQDPRVVVWLRGENKLPDTPAEFALYLAFLEYAECVVGINTTGMVDAAIYGQQVITLDLPRYRGSNAREADHIKIIADSRIFFDAQSLEEVADKITEKMTGNRIVPEKCVEDFITMYVRPRGRHLRAGRLAAEEITGLARSTNQRVSHS